MWSIDQWTIPRSFDTVYFLTVPHGFASCMHHNVEQDTKPAAAVSTYLTGEYDHIIHVDW